MKSTTYRRGQVVIPATLRTKYGIKTGDQLIWVDNGQTIHIIPIPSNPIEALYRRGKGQGLMQKIFKERAKDK